MLSASVTRGLHTAMLVLCVALAGCDLNLRPGSESIIEAVQGSMTPGEMAAAAINPYDANDRYLGTLGLANENFANEPVYIKLFEDNLNDPEASVRAAAVRGLAAHGEPSHVPLLVRCLSDRDKLVRLEAARGLQRLHDASAVAPLIRAMKEPDPSSPKESSESEPSIRVEAALALGHYPENRVLNALIAGLDDNELAVNRAAHQSLATLTGQDFGLDRAAWVDWQSRSKDPFAAEGVYTYPIFSRDLFWFEYIPFVPKPRNEVTGQPAGMPRG
jgi:hypothetical protein